MSTIHHSPITIHIRAVRFILLLVVIAAQSARAVELGIDRLEQMGFAPLAGKRVGLITNHTGVDSRGAKTRVILKRAPSVNLVALFTPEHGLDGTERAGRWVPSRRDPVTGLMAHSLYGPTRKPTPEMLRGIDCLVFDMQDIGVRSYTYVSTMAKCMEAAGEAGIEFIVLDRPNPLGGVRIEGPSVEPGLISFVGQLPVPVVHGMTVGELARMTIAKHWIAASPRLRVIEMSGWQRAMAWADTGLRWVSPSPNIPHRLSPAYYAATGTVGEIAGIETGCDGPLPFEVFGARWLDADEFTAAVRRLAGPGVAATPYRGSGFQGVRLQLEAHASTNFTALGLSLLDEANRRSRPSVFARSSGEKLMMFYKCYGSAAIRQQLERSTPVAQIAASWRTFETRFGAERAGYLLY